MKLHNGDSLIEFFEIEDNSIDSLVTDPPAGISFMGKEWDHHKGGRKEWVAWMTEIMTECLRVMKPGAHGLVWALPRTSHWTATALEDAGFEVRDVVTHLFGTGFPKSMNVAIALDKQAGAMKARGKGFNTAGQNVQLNQNRELRSDHPEYVAPGAITDAAKQWQGWGTALKPASEHWILVRKPCSEKTVAANVLKWGTGAINVDASRVGSEAMTSGGNCPDIRGDDFNRAQGKPRNVTEAVMKSGRFPANLTLDEYAAGLLDEQAVQEVSRFFYVAKASKADKGAENTHPTVKSTALMTYLIRMVTPPGGTVLDPFMGSGSTGVAATKAKFDFIGIEKEKDFFEIAKARILNAKGRRS